MSIVSFIFALIALGLGLTALIKVISGEKSTHSAIVSGYSTFNGSEDAETIKEAHKVFDDDLMSFGERED